ncbi:MAG: hypothetical protein ACOH1T_02605 [Microbacteriaceae bacterium]
MPSLSSSPYPDIVRLSRDCATSSERSALSLDAKRGVLVRVASGAYVDAAYWRTLDEHHRHLTLITVARSLNDDLVLSHASAAALWRLPWLGVWPTRVDVIVRAKGGGASTALLARHSTGPPRDTVAIDGVRVTTLARTVVDLASRLSFGEAVALADAAVRRGEHPVHGLSSAGSGKDALRAELENVPVSHGRSRAGRVIEFADGRADRPGESLSRATMSAARISAPELQVELRGASGRSYWVDFWWPEFCVFGEFDGRVKYSDPVFLRGRSPEQALYDEKLREDDLRAAGRGCARWNWEVARSIPQLRARLAAAGVR